MVRQSAQNLDVQVKPHALGPVYRLPGQGFSDRDIAKKLDLTELSAEACMLYFLGFTNRNELIRYAAAPTAM
jgi:hypothetical protein